jgi:putative membrane protein
VDDANFQALRTRVAAITRPEPALLVYYFLTALLSTVAFPLIIIPLFFRYETLKYRFDDQGVFMSYGILFRREMQLTYARMQDIHLSQNILERWLHIGTVTVQTAGSGEGGNLGIVGVKDFEGIRDYLYARMRGVRDDSKPAAGSDALHEIRDALVRTAEALKAVAERR